MAKVFNQFMKPIEDWLFKPVSMLPLAYVRILFGCSVLGEFLLRIGDIEFLFGPHGFAGHGFYQSLPDAQTFAEGFGQLLVINNSSLVLWFLYCSMLISTFLFTIGYKTRVFGLIAWTLFMIFHQRNIFSFWGWTKLFQGIFLYVVLSQSHLRLSIDALRNNYTSDKAPAWPMRLLQVHICSMYFLTGNAKFFEPNWMQSHGLLAVFEADQFIRVKYSHIQQAWLLWPVEYFFILLESLAAIGLWLKKTRRFFVVNLFTMHVLIEILTFVGFWSHMMIGGLICFISPETLEKPIRWIQQILNKLRTKKLEPPNETPA